MVTILTFTLLFVFSLHKAKSHFINSFEHSSSHVHSNDLRLIPTARKRAKTCGDFCEFRLCNINGLTQRQKASFTVLGSPNTATSPFICMESGDSFEVDRSEEAHVFINGTYIPISKWRPENLSDPYPSNFIQTFKLPGIPRSGIGRIATTGNQWDFLHNKCMILPIQSLSIKDPEDGETRILETDDNTESGLSKTCVAFRTTAPELHVELIWNSGDDFDLEVVEPDGEVIDFFNNRTSAGKLNGDNNVNLCERKLPTGKENIVFFPRFPIERGTYSTSVRHFKTCSSESSTAWKLRVMKKGVLVLKEEGISSVEGDDPITTEFFDYP